MKQRITVEQLKKLDEKQLESLRKWWKPEYGDYFKYYYGDEVCIHLVIGAHDGNYGDDANYVESYPLLSIGQMIELINEKKPLKSITKARFDKWIVNIETATLGYKDELCDSLWETVMRIL